MERKLKRFELNEKINPNEAKWEKELGLASPAGYYKDLLNTVVLDEQFKEIIMKQKEQFIIPRIYYDLEVTEKGQHIGNLRIRNLDIEKVQPVLMKLQNALIRSGYTLKEEIQSYLFNMGVSYTNFTNNDLERSQKMSSESIIGSKLVDNGQISISRGKIIFI